MKASPANAVANRIYAITATLLLTFLPAPVHHRSHCDTVSLAVRRDRDKANVLESHRISLGFIEPTYQSIVLRRPASNDVAARNPNSLSARLTSRRRRGWPFGWFVSQMILPVKPVICAMVSARSRIEISILLPRITGSGA